MQSHNVHLKNPTQKLKKNKKKVKLFWLMIYFFFTAKQSFVFLNMNIYLDTYVLYYATMLLNIHSSFRTSLLCNH